MRHSTPTRSISCLQENAAAAPRMLAEQREPIEDTASCEQAAEQLSLLELLTLGSREIEEGKVTPVAEAVDRLRATRRSGG